MVTDPEGLVIDFDEKNSNKGNDLPPIFFFNSIGSLLGTAKGRIKKLKSMRSSVTTIKKKMTLTKFYRGDSFQSLKRKTL